MRGAGENVISDHPGGQYRKAPHGGMDTTGEAITSERNAQAEWERGLVTQGQEECFPSGRDGPSRASRGAPEGGWRAFHFVTDFSCELPWASTGLAYHLPTVIRLGVLRAE